MAFVNMSVDQEGNRHSLQHCGHRLPSSEGLDDAYMALQEILKPSLVVAFAGRRSSVTGSEFIIILVRIAYFPM